MIRKLLRGLLVALLVVCVAGYSSLAEAQKKPQGGQKSSKQAAPTRAQLNAALATAVGKRDFDRVSDLLKRGADPNAVREGSPILVLAVAGGDAGGPGLIHAPADPDMVAALLAAGAKPDAVNSKGETALLVAARLGESDLCDLLLANHASVDLADKEGMTPLMEAMGGNNIDVVELLLTHKANINARDKVGLTPLAYAILSKGQGLLSAYSSALNGVLKNSSFR